MRKNIIYKHGKKIQIFLILAILILGFSNIVNGYQKFAKPSVLDNLTNGIISQFQQASNPQSTYEAEDITLQDAAFHRSSDRFREEWWYFDAIFDNGCSVAISIVTASKGSHGICSTGIVVYNNTKLEFHVGKKFLFKEFEVSEEFPCINVSGKQVLKFDKERYDSTGEWVYNVSLKIDGQEANLQFIGTTEGYKGEVFGGWYGPVLPKATVEGNLTLNGEKIVVSGLGYHEHAWEICHPIREFGWFWSKISSESFSLAWAKLMQTRWKEKMRVAVFSQDQAGYINIDPAKIKFRASNYIFDHRRLIPTKFTLNISDPENSIYINISMDALSTHHYGKFIFHYWRYHLLINGEITYGSTTELIEDQIQTMEFMRFR